MSSAADGRPVPVVVQNDRTKRFELDQKALESVLLAPEVKDTPVCVLSVAGGFRMGKSFLLDFLLRYCINRESQDWLGDPLRPLEGFRWRYGRQRETTGISVWSKPFIFKRQSGERVAVILMDTQGTFDTQSSMKDMTVVFALAMMVSSVLVYNLMRIIGEDDLMHFELFTSYALLSQDEEDQQQPFQRLQFLVRDWEFADDEETPYGSTGGQRLLDELLRISHGQQQAHQNVRTNMIRSFRDIRCYLMPSPGLAKNNKAFDGRVADLDEQFVHHLRLLVPQLLAPENLVVKEFGGHTVSGQGLFNLFREFMEVFKHNSSPDPTSLADFAARSSCQAALDAARTQYTQEMDSLTNDQPALKSDQLLEQHENKKVAAIDIIDRNKYGRMNPVVKEQYRTELEKLINALLKYYLKQNESKREAEVLKQRMDELKAEFERETDPVRKAELQEEIADARKQVAELEEKMKAMNNRFQGALGQVGKGIDIAVDGVAAAGKHVYDFFANLF